MTKPEAATATPKRSFESIKRTEIWKVTKAGVSKEGTFKSLQWVMGRAFGEQPPSEFVTFNFESDPVGTDTRGQLWSVSSAMLKNQMDLVPIGTYCKITSKEMFQEGNMPSKSRDFLVETEHGAELLVPGEGHFSKKPDVAVEVEGPEPESVPEANGAAVATPTA